MMKLNLNELDNVSGGFQETNKILPTHGMNIKCPKCGSSHAHSFAESALYDPSIGSVEYTCKCGCHFICYNGQVLLKDDWDKLCKQKGIKYGF